MHEDLIATFDKVLSHALHHRSKVLTREQKEKLRLLLEQKKSTFWTRKKNKRKPRRKEN